MSRNKRLVDPAARQGQPVGNMTDDFGDRRLAFVAHAQGRYCTKAAVILQPGVADPAGPRPACQGAGAE